MRLGFPSVDRLRARQGSKWSKFPPGVLPVTPAESDLAPCPAVDDALRGWLHDQRYGYPLQEERGPAEALRNTFSRRMCVAFDWVPDPRDTQLTVSGSQALIACVLAYSGSGDGVAFHTPVFPALRSAVENAGRRPVPQPMLQRQGRFVLGEMTPEPGEARMFLLCNPHNPTGRAFDAEELGALARWIEREDIVVISDELHADLMLDGRRHKPFAKLFPALAERTVTLCSPSKAFGLGGLGCAILHFGSRELEKLFRTRIPPELLGEPAVPSLLASEAAWRSGSDWLQSVTGLIERSRNSFMEQLAGRAPGIRLHAPDATFFVWADLRGLNAPERPFDLMLRKGRIAASDGAHYGDGFDGFARFVLAMPPERVHDLVSRLVSALPTSRGIC